MKIRLLLPFFFSLFLFTACSEKKPVEQIPQTDSIPVVKNITTDSLVSLIIKRRNEIREQLKKLSPEHVNSLYVSYKAETDSLIIEIENVEAATLDIYQSLLYNREKRPLPDSVKTKASLLKKASLEFYGIGEGMTEIRAIPTFYTSLFSGRLTKDYEEFITLNAHDEKELYSSDAAIGITWIDLGKRLSNWEKFVTKYPKSNLYLDAQDIYLNYQSDFLIGMDNTPTMEYTDTSSVLYPENIEAFDRYLSANPNTFSAELIQLVMAYEGRPEPLWKMISDRQELFKKKATH